MQEKVYFLIITMSLLLNVQSFAQNQKERRQNNKQITEGKQNLERDTRELLDVKSKVKLFDNHFEAKELDKVNALQLKIIQDFRREVQQSEVKAVKARREVSQSSAEVRSERREIRDNKKDSERGRFDSKDDEKDMRRDRRNKRDDKRDRRDDKRDLEAQIERADEQKRILDGLTSFTFGFEGALLEKSIAQRALMEKFITTMEEDIVATKKELAEDNRERNEDRRERRDDRNERKERGKRGGF